MNSKIILSYTFFLEFLLFLFSAIFFDELSITLFQMGYFFIGITIIFMLKRDNSKDYLILFNLFFFIYSVYAIATNYFYVTNPLTDFFYAKDSIVFYDYAIKASEANGINNLLNQITTDYYSYEWKGFAYFISINAYIANLIDSNTILIHKIYICFFSCINVIFLFSLLKKYLKKKLSFILAFLFGIFSCYLFYSAIFLRDVIINTTFLFMFYIVLGNYSFKGLLLIILTSLLIFSLRIEYGIFSLGFPVVYLWCNNRRKTIYFILLLGLFGVFVFRDKFSFIINSWEFIEATTNRFNDFSEKKANLGSLGAKLLKLPFGVKHIAAGSFSQIIPFPFYSNIPNQGLGFIPQAISALFWFGIWGMLIPSFIKKPFWKELNKKLLFLFFLSIVLILGASVNADARRIMCVYPIIFILFAIAIKNLNAKQIINRIINSTIAYILLLMIYLVIKY